MKKTTRPKPYLGYLPLDMETPHARYFEGKLRTIQEHIEEKLGQSPLEEGVLPDFKEVTSLLESGYACQENGFSLEKDGSAHIAVLTKMPDVSPRMWDWWFGWHGSEDSRYKLWHPESHVSARWKDDLGDIGDYIGRTSFVDEYIGGELQKAAVRFVSPVELGFHPNDLLDKDRQVFICARLGYSHVPLDFGWLVHQVRVVEGGSEMRSRFWLGGKYISIRARGILPQKASSLLQQTQKVSMETARAMMLHCAEEMNHLAVGLPEIYKAFGENNVATELLIQGQIIEKSNPIFEKELMGTLFNKCDPGRRPDMIVRPKTVRDIEKTVHCAKQLGKKVSICSGGHSWSANHVRNDSILIDMGNFNDFDIDEKKMLAQAGPGIGGSVLLGELEKRGLFFPAGHCKGVCIGGYLLQGGFAWNGRKLGLACESVVGIDLVTADGQFIRANADENADLYWAARGAGGGFFGVVVCFHLKLYPLPKHRGMIVHEYGIKHMEEVYRWAHEIGPQVSNTVEFQIIMSRKKLNALGASIKVTATVFADTEEEVEKSLAFMYDCPIKSKAMIRTPFVHLSMDMLYRLAMTHYPHNHHWGVDNMWTRASFEELLPHLRRIAETLPPPPAHFLWLSWEPPTRNTSMAFSVEDNIYWALYGAWRNTEDTGKYENWAVNILRGMENLTTGIQLADEGLHKRKDRFMAQPNLDKLDEIRTERDADGLFNAWHSRPDK